jgi:hypothetical protein
LVGRICGTGEFAGRGRADTIPIRISNPGIHGIHDIFRGAVICSRFWEVELRSRQGAGGIGERKGGFWEGGRI